MALYNEWAESQGMGGAVTVRGILGLGPPKLMLLSPLYVATNM